MDRFKLCINCKYFKEIKCEFDDSVYIKCTCKNTNNIDLVTGYRSEIDCHEARYEGVCGENGNHFVEVVQNEKA